MSNIFEDEEEVSTQRDKTNCIRFTILYTSKLNIKALQRTIEELTMGSKKYVTSLGKNKKHEKQEWNSRTGMSWHEWEN